MLVSSVPIRCCTDYIVAGKCTVHGKDHKEDKIREEADKPGFLKCQKQSKSDPKDG